MFFREPSNKSLIGYMFLPPTCSCWEGCKMYVLVFKLLPVTVFSVCSTLVVCYWFWLCWFLGEDKCLKKSSYLLDILNWLLVLMSMLGKTSYLMSICLCAFMLSSCETSCASMRFIALRGLYCKKKKFGGE